MFGRLVLPALLLLVSVADATAQTSQNNFCDITASVGVPYSCDLGAGLSMVASEIPPDSGVSFMFNFKLDPASSLPPGLSISSDGQVSGTPTQAGMFDVTIDFSVSLSVMGMQIFTENVPFPFPIDVSGSTANTTVVDPSGLTFAFNHGDTASSSQTISLFNRSAKPAMFTASASSDNNWLSVSPSSGSAGAFQPASIVATANPSGMIPGVYMGNVTVAVAGGQTFNVVVVLTVNGSKQGIKLSGSGLHFLAVQNGVSPPDQNISVLNQGTGTVNFSVSVATVSGGNWLTVSPASGGASPTSPVSVAFQVTPKGLAPGIYYATATFTATARGEEDSPQTVTVVLNVFSPNKNPGPALDTTGLIFVAQAGGQNPASQNFVASNPSPNPLTFATTPFADSGSVFFTVQPSSGMVSAGSPQAIAIQPVITGLAAGVYFGQVVATFTDPSTTPPLVFVRHVAVIVIIVPAGSVAARADTAAAASGCTPTKLIPVFTQLGAGFQVSAGWPTPIEVTVVDDCGNFTSKDSVVVGFSSGDPALSLTSLDNGRWTATWNPHGASATQVTISAAAQEKKPALQGNAQIGGALAPNPTVPVVSSGGVVSAASNAAHQPIGPGSYVSIYGTGFSSATHISKKLPLPTSLAGTQVLIGSKPMPLYFTSTGQINAIVPFNVPVNTTQQLLVSTNGAVSVPEPVVLATAQPAIFTKDNSGKGPGVIVAYKPHSSTPFSIDEQHPASAGDTLVIYCSGLGPVDQPVAAGAAGPSSPVAKTVNPVTATIGGKTASVKFSGLAPGFTVYQVNVVVPQGVPTGNSVPVVLSVSGLESDPVTIVVK